ncbi:hypothetical protein KIL84_007403 [Mauremys mutica]|uniref:Uncharacterized protein n=1 Tax=Mauremys mutica TaxID=74926 RepID=A0A9D3X3A8_9SAUR|nr:hypothetical protein KIL84_007403 [Mauremys mutica]
MSMLSNSSEWLVTFCGMLQPSKDPELPTKVSLAVPGIPAEYIEYAAVFDKQKADALLPQHSDDCTIDLQPGTGVPFGCIYTLSAPQLQALQEYLEENLRKRFIVP